MYLVKEAKSYPITSIMDSLGSDGNKTGGKVFYSSPFSSDTTPSFCVYVNTNTYHDFSNGFGGDSIDLYKRLKNCSFKQAVRELCSETSLDDIENYITKTYKQKNYDVEITFSKESFIVKSPNEVEKIRKYAESRCIRSGYYPAIIPDYSTGERIDKLAMMFVHINENMNECGAKFRFISPSKIRSHKISKNGNRFTSRGSMRFYVLENLMENHFSDPVMYFVESETSANSLWEICKKYDINCIIISMGGVTNKIQGIPLKYEYIKDRYLIIDYDGDENSYKKRLSLHGEVGKPIKMLLPKGEDFNSLLTKGKESIIKNLILK